MYDTIVENIIMLKYVTKIIKFYVMNDKNIAYIDCFWKNESKLFCSPVKCN